MCRNSNTLTSLQHSFMDCGISKPTFLFILPFTDFEQQSLKFDMSPVKMTLNRIDVLIRYIILICMSVNSLNIFKTQYCACLILLMRWSDTMQSLIFNLNKHILCACLEIAQFNTPLWLLMCKGTVIEVK